jgi:serine protease Do
MALDIVTKPSGSELANKISETLIQLFDQVKPGVVQVTGKGRGNGAGVVWRTDGAILTNQHVVGNQDSGIEVHLPDGRKFEAQVVARDSTLDLALLMVAATDLPAVPVADSSQLRIGEMVFAIGHPWGIKDVVTAGIVSGLGTVTAPHNGRTATYIRSDVVLAPGNSGGPLLNAEGAVVGINAMIFGGDMSVSIPAHVAAEWVAGIPSRRVYLGVGVQPVELPETLKVGDWSERTAGLLVVATEKGGLAESHGVFVGDVLMEIAGTPVKDAETLRNALNQRGSSIRLGLLRGGTVLALDVTITETAGQ